MKLKDRRRVILDVIQSGSANVEALGARLGVSEATVRRDLTALAQEGAIVRTYGGAAANLGRHEPETPLRERQLAQRAQKDAIALLAAAQVQENDTVLLDGGTTAEAFARRLAGGMRIEVVTNNLLAIAHLAGSAGIRATLLGGELRPSSMSTFGPLAQAMTERLSADKAFLGADGIVARRGLCEATAEQAYLKECLIRQATEIYVLADASKLGRAAQRHWTPLSRPWTLITDASASAEQLDAFHALPNVTVLIAKPD